MTTEDTGKPVPAWGQVALGLYWLLLMAFLTYFTAKLWPQVPSTTPKASEAKSAEPKSSETKGAAVKGAETKVVEATTAESKSSEKKKVEPKSADEKKAEAKVTEQKKVEPQSTEEIKAELGSREQQETRWVWLFGGMIRFAVTREVRLILLVLAVGALGGCIHAATSFAAFAGNERLHGSWVWYYVLRPPIGAVLALIVYFVVRGGFLSLSGTAAVINDFGIVAVAGLVGMFSKQATAKLDELFSTLFRTDKPAQLGGKLANKAPVLTAVNPATIASGSGDTKITVTGSDFVQKSELRWEGSALVTQFVRATELTATVPAAKLASKGSFEVTVFSPAPGGGTSNAIKVVVS